MVGMYRRNVLLGTREVVGCQNADLVVNPKHRRKGLAVRILKECFEDAPSLGYQVSFGFPNKIARPAHRHAGGWNELGTFQVSTLRPNPLHALGRRAAARVPGILGRGIGSLVDALFASRAALPRKLRGFEIDDDVPAKEAYDPLWRAVATGGGFLGVRDFAWHRWRFREKPNYDCRVLYARRDGTFRGFIALSYHQLPSGMVVVSLVDILALDREAREALLEAGVAEARRGRAVQLAFPRLGPVCRDVSFGTAVTDSGQIVFVRALAQDGVAMPEPAQWAFTFADSDVT